MPRTGTTRSEPSTPAAAGAKGRHNEPGSRPASTCPAQPPSKTGGAQHPVGEGTPATGKLTGTPRAAELWGCAELRGWQSHQGLGRRGAAQLLPHSAILFFILFQKICECQAVWSTSDMSETRDDKEMHHPGPLNSAGAVHHDPPLMDPPAPSGTSDILSSSTYAGIC